MSSAAQEAVEQQTDEGFIAFNPARRMRVAERERVQVNIRRTLSQNLSDSIKQELSEGLSEEESVEFEKIAVGGVMTVRLDQTESFSIDPITSERQVLDDEVTSWKWDVTPLRRGNHTLTLCVEIEIKMPDGRIAPEGSCEFEKEIEVAVNPLAATSSFVGENWQWLIGGPIGTALIAWLGRKDLRRRQQAKASGDPSSG